MSSGTGPVDRKAVLDRLDRVTDPELDRSIVELDYIDELHIGPETVVQFKLPTAWCSPAFAWMMASDIRDGVLEMGGVESVEVRLIDHMHADEITHGVNAGRAFDAVFDDSTEGVGAVRATLDGKARLARQFRAVEALLDIGVRPEQICGLARRDVSLDQDTGRAGVELDGVTVYVSLEPIVEYLDKARDTGIVTGPDSRLFATPEGEPIAPGEFELVHRRARLARVNMGGQGTVCDALHRARYGNGSDAEADD